MCKCVKDKEDSANGMLNNTREAGQRVVGALPINYLLGASPIAQVPSNISKYISNTSMQSMRGAELEDWHVLWDFQSLPDTYAHLVKQQFFSYKYTKRKGATHSIKYTCSPDVTVYNNSKWPLIQKHCRYVFPYVHMSVCIYWVEKSMKCYVLSEENGS